MFDLCSERNTPVDALRHEEVDAKRRGDEAERQVHDHDNTELDGVVAKSADEREEDRGVDIGGSRGLHEAAVDQQDHVDDKQDDDPVIRDAEDQEESLAGTCWRVTTKLKMLAVAQMNIIMQEVRTARSRCPAYRAA